MELKEFVARTLTDIIEGIQLARENIKPLSQHTRASIAPSSGYVGATTIHSSAGGTKLVEIVEFDVAVTASEGSEIGGKAGVFAYVINVGSEGKKGSSTEAISRVKFSIPITLP